MDRAKLKNLLIAIVILAAIAAVILVKTNPGVLIPKKTGSFEYVRKGEAQLRKGHYREAIASFEKAYDGSPENDAVKSNLVFAYSRYGAELSSEGKHAEAIELFTRACDVTRTYFTMQNLALAYARKAVSEAEKGDWFKALEDFTNARFAAEDSNIASKNLAISLFNDAVAEYKSGRERIALMCLKEAALSYDDSRIMEFTGDVYYRKQDLETALFYYTRASGLQPGSDSLAGKIEKASKEIALAEISQSKALPHFELRYEKSLTVDDVLINSVLEEAYRGVGRDLDYFPSDKTVVFFYSEDNFRNIFKMPAIVRAFYDGSIRMPFPASPLSSRELEAYIFHEYTHAVVSAKTNNNCPVWLSEGIAVLEENRSAPLSVADIWERSKGYEFSIRAMDAAFKGGSFDKKGLAQYYLIAYTAARFIVDNWGMAGLRAILDRMAAGKHAINAIDDEFLLSEKEFEKRWRDYASKKAP